MECIKTQHHESRIIFQAFVVDYQRCSNNNLKENIMNKITTVFKFCEELGFVTSAYRFIILIMPILVIAKMSKLKSRVELVEDRSSIVIELSKTILQIIRVWSLEFTCTVL
jgi:hypothetical protein